MDVSSDLLNAPKKFLRLFKAGKEAARQGDNARAHELFRQAIEVDPYHEQVWLWLASVVETDEDRQVCFENVLELNPTNPTARRLLQQLEQKAIAKMLRPDARLRKRSTWQRWLLRLALVGLLVTVGVVVALVFGLI